MAHFRRRTNSPLAIGRPSGSRENRRYRPHLEALEDRTLLSASLVKDTNLNTLGSDPADLVNVGGVVYFTAVDNTNQVGLWKSDSSTAGTVLVKDLGPAPPPGSESLADDFTVVGNTLYFTLGDNSGDPQLWKSDGSAAGTVIVRDFPGKAFPGPNGASASPPLIAFQ